MGLFSTLQATFIRKDVQLLSLALPRLGDLLSALLPGPTPEVVARLPRVVIVGEGGTGKSTIVKQMLAFAARQGLVPVWVSLSLLPVDQPLTPASLIDYLVEQARRHLGMEEIQPAFFHALIEDGQLAIGFDALDEIGSLSRQQMVRGLIMEIAREWKRCRIFVTSRPGALTATPLPTPKQQTNPGVDRSTEVFIVFRPLPFEMKDIQSFLRTSFDDVDGHLADTILALQNVGDLVAEPLTLTLFALMAGAVKGAQLSRASLFERCIVTLCESWDDAKGSLLTSDGLTADVRIAALRCIAWELQRRPQATISVDDAATALIRSDPPIGISRAIAVVGALAQRNALLSSTRDDGPGRRLRAIGFMHPQFREYLAGAHLAERFRFEPDLVPALMAEIWFDSRWLEAIRFCASTLEERSAEHGDGFLQLALAAEDPFGDLLHRPTLLVARLLASAGQADDNLVAHVVGKLETIAGIEPALRENVAELLLGLASQKAARAGLVRWAKGEGIALAFSADDCLRWRLRALETLSAVAPPKDVLPLLSMVDGEESAMKIAELRARLGDRDAALAAWQSLFETSKQYWSNIAASMDGAGEGAAFDAWLLAAIARTPSKAALVLGHERHIVSDAAPAWVEQFQQAAEELAGLNPDEDFAPQSLSDVVYAALESGAGAASPAGRALLEHALRHPALTWFVAPRISQFIPALAGPAVETLLHLIERVETAANRPDFSRLNSAYKAICDEPDDALAGPALLRLLAPEWRLAFPHRGHVQRRALVAGSIARRGLAAEGLDIIDQRLESPLVGGALVEDAHANWRVAYVLGPTSTLDRIERRLVGSATDAADWLVTSGAVELGVELFDRVVERDDGQALVETFGALESCPEVAAAAKAAIARYFGRKDAERASWTTERLEIALASAIENGRYIDPQGVETAADPDKIGALLGVAISLGDEATTMQLANDWVERRANAAMEGCVDGLTDALATLSRQGLANRGWRDAAAAVARKFSPTERTELVAWLQRNA